MATKAETRDRVGTDLGILTLGQQLQFKDQTRIESGYDEIYEDLKDEGLAVWSSTGSVPTKLVPHVVALVALNCAGSFSVSQERLARILLVAGQDGELAKRNIRRLVADDWESLEEVVDF